MTSVEPQPTVPTPNPRFQFSLRTLLLLCVVLGSSLGVFGAAGIVVFAILVGLAIYLREARTLLSLTHLVLIVLCLLCVLGWLLVSFINVPREANRRAGCLNSLHQIALALRGYQEANGSFPPAYTVDKSGNPLHSWRTLILPDFEYTGVFNSFDLSQPWDAPKNKVVSATSLRVYDCPSDPGNNSRGGALTSYVAVVDPNAAWAGDKPRKLADFGDDPSTTIMLAEATNSGINWAEPRDFPLDSIGLSGTNSPAIVAVHHYGYDDGFFFKFDHGSGVHVAMADGSVGFLRTDNLSPDELRQALQIGGCKEGTIGAHAIMTDDTGRRLNWPNIAALAVWLVSVGTLLTAAVRSRKKPSVPATPPTA